MRKRCNHFYNYTYANNFEKLKEMKDFLEIYRLGRVKKIQANNYGGN